MHIDSPHTSKRLGIEMVYQNLELCQNLNVFENLYLGRELLREPVFRFLRRREMEKKSVEILHKLKIEIQDPRKRVDRLSGGQQQAVAISKAVSFGPRMLILDEPTANLALKEIGKVLDIVQQLKANGISGHLHQPQARRRVLRLRQDHRAARRQDRRGEEDLRDDARRDRALHVHRRDLPRAERAVRLPARQLDGNAVRHAG